MQILLFSISKGHNSINMQSRVMDLCSAHHLMLVSNLMKFHHYILNSFQLTRSRADKTKRQILLFPISKGYNSKICYPELRFLCSAHRLMLVDIPMKFHNGIFNGFSRYRTDKTYMPVW